MDLFADAQTWYIIGTVLFAIGAIYALRFARSKGVDTEQIAKDVAQIIDYSKILLALSKATEETKGKINTGLDAAKVVAQFVTDTNIATTPQEEKELANRLVKDLLDKYNIEPTIEEKVFMEQTIDKAILENKNKNTIKVINPVE